MREDIHIHHHFPQDHQAPAWVKEMMHKLGQIKEIIVATKEEVKADIEEIKTEVAAVRGVGNSVVLLIERLLSQVGDAAADAADLDEFRTELAKIKTEITAEKEELAAQVEKNP